MNVPVAVVALVLAAAASRDDGSFAELAGAWDGSVSHAGESERFALELEPAGEGKLNVKLSIPAAQIRHSAIGRVMPVMEGGDVKIGPFRLRHDRATGTLRGLLPEALAPVYELPLELRKVAKLELPERPEPSGDVAQPLWTFDAGAPLWPGATLERGTVYAGAEDGRLHALDARSGATRWSFRAGGAIRTRPTRAGDGLFFQADDGVLYALDARTGAERWRQRVSEKPVLRLPVDDPKSRFDRFGADVAVARGRLYVGTHDGRVLALDPARGSRLWEFVAGDSVLAAPAVAGGRVYFGSYDGHVYALDAARGSQLWKHDTRKPVVSTPAVDGDRVLVGSRSYDFMALDARTGERLWTRYFWFSWVESSARLRDGVAYVGSSDAAGLFAFDARSGQRLWKADVYGWAWGQPAVTGKRVFIGTVANRGYMAQHRGGGVAVDRKTGRTVWRFPAPPDETKPYGFPGSPAVGDGVVVFGGLDGRLYAFRE